MSRLSDIGVSSSSGPQSAQVVTTVPSASVSRPGAGTNDVMTPGVSHDTEIFHSDTSSDNSEINTGPSDTSDDEDNSDNDAEESNDEPAAKAKRAYRTKYIREQE